MKRPVHSCLFWLVYGAMTLIPAAWSLLTPLSAGAFVLVGDRLPVSFIVIAPNAGPAERYAASELADGLRHITGAELPVREMNYRDIPSTGRVVLIGKGDWFNDGRFANIPGELDMLGDQGFIIRASEQENPQALIVCGRTPRGTVYAAMSILRFAGVRWYNRDTVRYPTAATVDLGAVDLSDLPCFDIRDVIWEEAGAPDEWRARLRLSAGYGFMERELGCAPVFVSLETTPGGLIPPEMFESDPDMFPFIDGARSSTAHARCLSNPETAMAAFDSLLAHIGRDSLTTAIVVSLSDEDALCTCPECVRARAEGGSGCAPALLWAERVGSLLSKRRPGVSLVLSLSGSFETPPESWPAPEAVIIGLTSLDADQRLYYEQSIDMRTMTFVANLQKWRELNARIVIRHPVGSHVSPLAPFPDFRQLTANIDMYHYQFVEGLLFECPPYPGIFSPFAELRVWLLSELMWDRYQDSESLVRDWMRNVYGNARGPMMDYWKHVQNLASAPNLRIGVDTEPDTYIGESWLSDADRMVQRAYALSLADADAHRHVVRERFGLRYVQLRSILTAPPGAGRRERYLRMLDTWTEDAGVLGIVCIDDSTTVDDFAGQVRKQLK